MKVNVPNIALPPLMLGGPGAEPESVQKKPPHPNQIVDGQYQQV